MHILNLLRKTTRDAATALGRLYQQQPPLRRRIVLVLMPAIPIGVAAIFAVRGIGDDPIGERPWLADLREATSAEIVAHPDAIDHIDVYRSSGYESTTALQVRWNDGRTTKTIMPGDSFKTLDQLVLLPRAIPLHYKTPGGQPQDFTTSGSFDFASVLSFLALLMGLFVVGQSVFGRNDRFDLIRPKDIDGCLDDLVGLDDIKRDVLLLADYYQRQSEFHRHGILRPWNVLFSGPTGTGKTRMAGALAKRLGVPLLYLDGARLETGLVGGGSRTLRKLERRARRLGRCVVFIDEGQRLLMQRSTERGSRHEDDTPNTLLALLDGVRTSRDVIWIIASNFDPHTSTMDDAVLRRFPMKVNFRLPNRDERGALLRHFLARRAPTVQEARLNIALLAQISTGLSPAQIQNIVDQASLLAILGNTKINDAILLRAFERVTIGLSQRSAGNGDAHQLEIVATHEAGHFLASVLRHAEAGRTLEEARRRELTVTVSLESVSHAGVRGYALQARTDDCASTLEDLRWQVRWLYGGRAAEEAVYGRDHVTDGASHDVDAATKLLVRMVGQLGFAPDGASKAPVNLTTYRGGAGQTVLSEREQSLVERIGQCEYAATRLLVERYRGALIAIREALLRHHRLSHDELFLLLAPFWPECVSAHAAGQGVPEPPTPSSLLTA